ncbi:MAG: hypothetical protein B6242_15285 [Anaerolineaceae bacterium 4572_78]|nr:MAG: hypothetical protein B6242_15285 [Anaerolineaceae bacterium 4572_78]
MQINYLDHLPGEFRASAVRLFIVALRDKFVPVFGNDKRVQYVLENSLDPTHCITAICDEKLVGLIAIGDSKGSFINPTLKTMIRTYGILGGIFRMAGLTILHHSTDSDELYIDGVAVVTEMRGKGVGSQLFAKLEHKAIKDGIQTISLAVINTNPRAEALYERLGFVSIKRDNIWPFNHIFKFPFESSVFMVKKIGGDDFE